MKSAPSQPLLVVQLWYHANGTRLLDRLGLYKPLLLRAAQAQEASLYSSQGKLLAEFEMAAWSAKKTGNKRLRIRRTDLQDILLKAI
jgi:2-polyprenyl-6-methoxyphenol hydroxylase-like FAD-dependent oxidoreductase